jgi:multisubunit Na+/H+ antiporter MnhE subunit
VAKLTIGFGVVLVLVSAGFWLATGRTETAALHPAGIGVLLILCGVLSNTENTKQRMIWMHVAVTAGLIGLLLTGIRALLTLIKERLRPTRLALTNGLL